MKGAESMLRMTQSNRLFLMLLVGLVGLFVLSGCESKPTETGKGGCATCTTCQGAPGKPTLLVSLEEKYNTPDGMTLCDKTNTIYLSAPNFNLAKDGTEEGTIDPKYPGVMLAIDADNKVTKLCDMPAHPETGHAGPMGLDIGPDGALYVADNQYFYDKDHKSRLIRVNMKDGKAVGFDVVVDGFKLSNAVVCTKDHVYVSDTFMDLPDKPAQSAVYRFKYSEFADGPVKLAPLGKDPHKIAQLTTEPIERRNNEIAGADGMTMDSKGNLYTGNFGDGNFYRISDPAGEAKLETLINDPDKLSCVDGIFCDLATDKIFIADSEKNAVQCYCVNSGKLTTYWMNDDTDGSEGLLDQPCEVLIRGNEMIIANFDMPFPGLKNTKFDAPYTVSVIKMTK